MLHASCSPAPSSEAEERMVGIHGDRCRRVNLAVSPPISAQRVEGLAIDCRLMHAPGASDLSGDLRPKLSPRVAYGANAMGALKGFSRVSPSG